MELPEDWRIEKKILMNWKIKQQKLSKMYRKDQGEKMNKASVT